MKKAILLLIVCLVYSGVQAVGDVELVDPNYVLELYAEYDMTSVGSPAGIAVDPDGNVYVTHFLTGYGYDGSVVKVDTVGNPSILVDTLTRPLGIVWAGGTKYGDYLYLTEGRGNSYFNKGGVTRITLDGVVERFSHGSGLDQPVSLGIDTTGNYGGRMYVGNGAHDEIKRVGTTGAISSFSPFPYNIAGAPSSISFDITGEYGESMFIAVQSSLVEPLEGLHKLDVSGNPTRFADELDSAFSAEFDNTSDSCLGGIMYAVAHKAGIKKINLFSVMPDGSSTLIVKTDENRTWAAPQIVFGDDELFMLYKNASENTAQIYRLAVDQVVSQIWKLEKAIAEKTAAVAKIDVAIGLESEVAYNLEQMDGNNLHKAMMRILQAVSRETHIKGEIEKSIASLQEAVEILQASVEN